MVSDAERLRKQLEARGEYVVRANASTGWFAVFPSTLLARTEVARRQGRQGPNLVVYTTTTREPRAHHVIPHSMLRELLVESTLTTSTVDGTKRWNLTLRDGLLHVSHRLGSIDASPFRGLPLLTEPFDASAQPPRPSAARVDDPAPPVPRTIPRTRPHGADALHRSVLRMANTARETVSGANGQQALRTIKNKDLRFHGDALEEHIRVLLEAQQGRCALTHLPLALDGEREDSDLLCSLDRIDSDGHYEAGNLQIVCRFANRWKGSDKDEAFRRLLSLVRTSGNQ